MSLWKFLTSLRLTVTCLALAVLLIFFGTPMAVALVLLIATGTAGFGFFLLPIYWIAVMVHVWAIPDRVVTAPEDEGEQY